ncbi:hypothetical protein NPIL_694311 [Nephila pilipes]|uniref:Uncharacterized protein n=1 Tax=Nephila pilipes TaxID=299642 RepID=A0A8X6NUM8_NEPPI|nr:hypothetical protein NPIL_247841 [Nephila pilipes]GFT32296.1 hypothetical protein NPIL_694311 [Nephila pilipes]
MVLLPFAAALLGIILVLIRYSLWRKKYCQNLPGIEPGLFNIPGDLTTLLMHAVLDKDHPILYHFGQILKERNELFQQQQLFYLWGFYKPHIVFVKAGAVKRDSLLKKYLSNARDFGSNPPVGQADVLGNGNNGKRQS